jgi:hypothetical protein
MLTTFVLQWAMAIITAPFTLLPTIAPLGINALATTITTSSEWPGLGWINNYFPLSEAIAYISFLVTIFIVMYLVKTAIWLWETIKP